MAEIQRSGKYKGKTRNLTKKQVAAGRRVGKAGKRTIGKKEAKQAMKAIDIRETSWKKAETRTGPRARGGIVVDRAGKPITGTVTLASGKTATYVRGKRVRAASQKSKPTTGMRSTTSRATSIPTTRPSAAQTGAGAGAMTRPTGPSAQQVAANARQRRAQQRRTQGSPMPAPAPTLKRGARRKVRQGDFVITYEWDGTRWTQAQKTRVTG